MHLNGLRCRRHGRTVPLITSGMIVLMIAANHQTFFKNVFIIPYMFIVLTLHTAPDRGT